MLSWALTEVNVHTSVWASTPNWRPNMSAEVERDFCDISVRRKYAAYKCPLVSGNTEKFKTLELLFNYMDWIFCQLFLHLHCLTALIWLHNGKHFALVSCCTWGSNHCSVIQCDAQPGALCYTPSWVEPVLRAHSCGHMQQHQNQSWEGHRMTCRHPGLASFAKKALSQKLRKKWIKHQRWPTAETSFLDPGIWKELLSREMLHWKQCKTEPTREASGYFSVQEPPPSCFLSPL